MKELIAGAHNNLIKIVTGLRRSGKSFLLFQLFRRHLQLSGVDDAHIIEVALDDRANMPLRDPDNMLAYIHSRISDDGLYYVLLDEVQLMSEFVDVLNSLLHLKNAQIYVTGSNSRFLSKDVATEFRGRGQEIHIYPLSFAEYYSAVGGSKSQCWKSYYTYGGLPQLIDYESDNAKEEFLKSLVQSVYIKDILERHNVKNQAEFAELMAVVASITGSLFNPTKLSNTFKSVKGISLDNKTIDKYLTYLSDAFIVERSLRYQVRGKKYVNALSKYYFQDVGLRNALLDFRQNEPGHLMENVVYNELRLRGYRVDVGQVEVKTTGADGQTVRQSFEVDFVANRGDERVYIQSAYALPDEEKRQQELASLLRIKDGFKRVVIVGDDIKPYWNEQGIYMLGVYDFLLDPDSLGRS